MTDENDDLTSADRHAIAEIRRKLDDEFRRTLDARFGPEPAAGQGWTPRRRRRGVVAVVLLGVLVASGLGVMARRADRGSEVTTRPTAHEAASRPDPAPTPWVAVSDVAVVREALDAWIEATRRGDIREQMRFYPARVPVYYTWRNVPRAAVQAEKVKVFGAANRLVITTGAPVIELARDQRTATTRFRKRYVIEGPRVRRRGEVLQELRWTRTEHGWVIVGERDARVLRSS